MTRRPPRWVRSARRRPTAFLAFAALSLFAVVVSTLAPLLLAATAATSLTARVAALRVPDDGFAIDAKANGPDALTSAVEGVTAALATAGESDLWTPARSAAATTYALGWYDAADPDGTARTSQVSIAVQACDGITITSGRCPTTVHELLVPASVAKGGGFPLDSYVDYALSSGRASTTAKVVGVYDDARGQGAVVADPFALEGSTARHDTANPVVGASAIADLPYEISVVGSRTLARPITAADEPEIRRVIEDAGTALLDGVGAASSSQVISGLPAVLRTLDSQASAAVTLTSPIALAALGLAWFALAYVSQRTARSRAVEWGIGRTRGVARGRWLGGAFVEPTVAVVVGGLLGYPVAVGLADLAARLVLGTSSGIDPLLPVALLAAGLALAGSLVALLAASLRSARLPLDALLRDSTEPRQVSRLALAAQTAVVLVTVVVLWTVLTTRLSAGPQLVLLLPILLAIVIGLAATRLTVALVRRGVRRRPRSLLGLVAGRGLARAPSVLGASVLVLVGAALAAYSLQLAAVAVGAQDDRTALQTGAGTVLTVSTKPGVDLTSAVRAADPSGRTALAAEEVVGSGAAGADRVVAVDTTRLAAVSTWLPGWRDGVDLGALHPAAGDDLVLRGSTVSVTVAHVANGTQAQQPPGSRLHAQLVVAGASGWTTVDLGVVQNGTLTAALPCADGCRVVSLGVLDPGQQNPSRWGVQLDLLSLRTDQQSAASLAPWLAPDRWRARIVDQVDPSLPSRLLPTTSKGRFHLEAQDDTGGRVAELEPAVGPQTLPAVAADGAKMERFAGRAGTVLGSDLASSSLLLHVVGRVPALPRSLTDGVLVDLAEMHRLADPSRDQAVREVWLAPGTHPAVERALRAAGVTVTARQTLQVETAAARSTSVPRSVELARATAIGAVVLALLALAAAWIVDAPAQRVELRALRLTGVEERGLRRVVAVRFAAPNVVAVLLGLLSGLLAFALTAGQLPLLAGQTAGPPIDTSPPLLQLAALVVAMVAAVLLVAGIGARAEVRGSRP